MLSRSDTLHERRDAAAPLDEAPVLRELAIVQMTALPLAIVVYPGRFDLAQNALSDLGLALSADGASNTAARLVFAANFVLSAIVLLFYARWCSAHASEAHARLKRRLALLAAAGALLAIFPHDRFQTLHGIGCGALIGSLWMIANLLSAGLWRTARHLAVVAQTVLQGSVLPYALAYAIDAPAKQLLQKLAVAGLVVSFLVASHAGRHAANETRANDRVTSSAPNVRFDGFAARDRGLREKHHVPQH